MKLTAEALNDRQLIKLVGDLDETFGRCVPSLLQAMATPNVEVDCAGIARISSIGVKAWCSFVSQIPSSTAYTFSRCSVVFVDYLNFISGFNGVGKVLSVMLSYQCANCGQAEEIELNVPASVPDAFELRDCSRCGEKTSTVTEPADYLAFIAA